MNESLRHFKDILAIAGSCLAGAMIAACLAASPAGAVLADEAGTGPFSQLSPNQKMAEDILRELVEFESTIEKPEETHRALQAVAARLEDAGFPAADVQIIHPYPESWGLVARYRGLGSPAHGPLLAMAHIDVVTADPDAWAFPPFTFGKKDGYYFGRGTQDNKSGVAHILANFVRLKQERYTPNRDLIFLVTGDEETQQKVIAWVASQGKGLIDADFALNSDGGGGELDDDGNPRAYWVQTSEKRYHTFRLTTTNPGGHSSLPRPDNAINELARALTRIADYRFPVQLNEGNRMMLERGAGLSDGQQAADMLAVARTGDIDAARRLSADPFFNAILRTTCVATGIKGGHAENALPRNASATVNCRIIPGVDPAAVQAALEKAIDDKGVRIETVYESVASPPSPLPPTLLETLESLVDESWPGVPLIPEMSTGGTDGLFLRNAGIPVYGVAGWFIAPKDIRAHGLDEKISIREFHQGTDFWYRMLKRLSSN